MLHTNKKRMTNLDFKIGNITITNYIGCKPDENGLITLPWKTEPTRPQDLSFQNDFNDLIHVINYIVNKTGFEIVMPSTYSYWNCFGDNPIGEFGGYEDTVNIFKAVTEFIKWNENTNTAATL